MTILILMTSALMLYANTLSASTYIPCSEVETAAQTCWSCGTTCSARLSYDNEQDAALNKNATLTFSGTGKMNNYKSPNDVVNLQGVEPWYNVRNRITKAVVEEGITNVGDRTIYMMSNLKEVSLPDSLTSIGDHAFFASSGLKKLTIPDGVTSIKPFAFQYTNIKELTLPESLTNLTNAFWCESKNPSCVPFPLEKLFCAEANMTACEAAVSHLNITPTAYQSSGGQYLYDNRFYNSPNDIASGNYAKKRIYTVHEANQVSGKKNTFKIRYK